MMFWMYMWIERIKLWFTGPECYKTEMGYNCRHRVYESGFKECGNRGDIR